MKWKNRRQNFRSILNGDICVHPASVFDPISARIAEDLKFECGILAGSVASMAILGAPDLVLITLSELTEQAHRINRASEIPLLVDGDHGYGNALNVYRTVEELETVGISALTIEDTALPQSSGNTGGVKLLSIEEGTGKMEAALSARKDSSLAIIGRTSAALTGGLEEAIRRGRAYESAGVDAMFFVGISDAEEIKLLATEFNIPLLLGGNGSGILGDRNFLQSQNVRISLQGHSPFLASVNVIYETLKSLRHETPPKESVGGSHSSLVNEVTRADDYSSLMQKFLFK
tara:strand:+ start:617 stop:1483 length:867 start_codon:yes stop_codon:yes gene_type:complete